MHKIADADDLERELRRLLTYSRSDRPSRSRLAAELQGLSNSLTARKKCASEPYGPTGPNGEPDNSYGRGYFEPPVKIRTLGHWCDNLKPQKVLFYKYFQDDGIWMVTTKCDHQLSVMGADLRHLLQLGLVRIQCNNPGTLAFYMSEADLD